jgi:ketosteroid isomerase-like protein
VTTRASALIERAERMLAAFNDANAPAVTAFYADDALLLPPDGTRVEGRVAIAEHLANILGNRELRMAITPIGSEIDGTLGYITGTYVLWSRDQPVSYVEVWKRVDGVWRITVDAIHRSA